MAFRSLVLLLVMGAAMAREVDAHNPVGAVDVCLLPGWGPGRGRTTTSGLWLPLFLLGLCWFFAPCALAMDVPERDVFLELHDRIADQLRGAPALVVPYLAKTLAAAIRDKLHWRRATAQDVPPS